MVSLLNRMRGTVVALLVAATSASCGDPAPSELTASPPEPSKHGTSIDPLVALQQAQLIASDGALSDRFGVSVAISGDTALVGAYFSGIVEDDKYGSVYVFTRTGEVWTEQQKLTASDGGSSDQFGFSVALSGDTALVGAFEDTIGANDFQGSAYVFTRSAGVWTKQQKLLADDGATSDHFGFSVALSGDTALVGANSHDIGANSDQGSAYVFTRMGAVWSQQQKLTASDGETGDDFGVGVALFGDTALVGADADNEDVKANQGSAYVFTRTGTTWTERQKLQASDGASADFFGSSVALSADTALVGADFDDVGANNEQGSVYVFTRAGVIWTEQQRLTAGDGADGDHFGISVAIVGDTALVGARSDDVGANSEQGSGYLFARTGEVWTEQQKLTASDGASNDLFGRSVALSADTALVGAFTDAVGGNDSQGSAYVFAVSKSNGDACAANAECFSAFCVDGVCCNTACDGGNSGDCQACSVAAGAPVNGTCAPSTGTMCDDGNACTQTDMCEAGTCAGAKPVTCTAMDECHEVGTCDPAAGMCSDVPKADGTACATGTCKAGSCQVDGTGGNGGAGGQGAGGGSTEDPGSCGCRVVGSDDDDRSFMAFAGLALAATTMLRRRRTTRG